MPTTTPLSRGWCCWRLVFACRFDIMLIIHLCIVLRCCRFLFFNETLASLISNSSQGRKAKECPRKDHDGRTEGRLNHDLWFEMMLISHWKYFSGFERTGHPHHNISSWSCCYRSNWIIVASSISSKNELTRSIAETHFTMNGGQCCGVNRDCISKKQYPSKGYYMKEWWIGEHEHRIRNEKQRSVHQNRHHLEALKV